LHGDWSQCSSPERPLQLDSNVVAIDPLGNSNYQIVTDTQIPVPVDVSIGRKKVYSQQQSTIPFEEVVQTNHMEKGMGVETVTPIGPEVVEAGISAEEVV
ncbi:hypothetical protein A2U01_0072287, partial [Trifolium medium]|nr:hypothetical protein [Trifolium medium]